MEKELHKIHIEDLTDTWLRENGLQISGWDGGTLVLAPREERGDETQPETPDEQG